MDDELAKALIQYFYEANQVIDKMAYGHSKTIAQRAFFDTLGGYLNYYMVPISMYSYYAGLIKLRTIENILELYGQTKAFLNTNGNGWRPSITNFSNFDINIEPLSIILDNNEDDTACIQLKMQDERTADGDNMIVALPRIETEEEGKLGNIWLPFKRKHIFNLRSVMSAFVLLRYFELTTKCYNTQGICQNTFNRKFKDWIVENLEIHFKDDVFYPGLGAALRIVETLRRKNNAFLVFAKTDLKRHKTQNYKALENRAKQLERHSEDWLKDIFGNTEPLTLDDKIEGTSLQKDSEDKRRMMYIYITIILAALLLIFVISVAYIIKWSGTEPDVEKTPKKEKRVSINENLGRRLSKDDEEVLLGPDSSSIASSPEMSKTSKQKKDIYPKNVKSPTTSKSSCFPLCTRKNSLELDKPLFMDSDSANEEIQKEDVERPSYSKSVPKLGIVNERKYVRTSKKTKKRLEEDEVSRENIRLMKENL